MRLFSTIVPIIALAVGVTLVVPVASQASDGATYKHGLHMHRVAYLGLPRGATALAPSPAIVPAAPAPETDGLSRDRQDCNYGCIDN